MKKLALLFVAVLAVGVTSCSKDDDAAQAALEGKWEYSKEGTAALGLESLVDWDHTPGCDKDYDLITSTNVTVHYFYKDSNGTTCSEETFSGAYTRNGNTITTNIGGEVHISEIVELSNTTLKIKNTQTEEGTAVDYITVYKRR